MKKKRGQIITMEEATRVRSLEAQVTLLSGQNAALTDRLEEFARKNGEAQTLLRVQKESIDSLRESEIMRLEDISRLNKMLDLQKSLAFVCAECGAPTSGHTDSIDNGTALKCDQCGKESVVSLRRLGEKDGDELHRVAEWAMTARRKLADYDRMNSVLDHLSLQSTLAICIGPPGRLHNLIITPCEDKCPVCKPVSP